MAKWAPDTFYDAAFDTIKLQAVRMTACSGQPANYAGIAAVALATATVSSADFTAGAATPDGRKLDVAAKDGVVATATGSATHVVLHDNSSKLLYVTTTDAPEPITSGKKVDFPAWDITIKAPL